MIITYTVILLFALTAAISWVNALERAEDRNYPTARQLRQWRRERLDLNPAMRRKP